MQYREYKPGDILSRYIQSYYLIESETAIVKDDWAFATGCVELMFNLGGNQWKIHTNGEMVDTPEIELWGQLTKPLSFRVDGPSHMFGIRFFPFSTGIFLGEDISLFNDKVSNLVDVLGSPLKQLQEQILTAATIAEKIKVTEAFLLNKLLGFEKRLDKIVLVQEVMKELQQEHPVQNLTDIANGFGLSSRYLQKIFLHYTGLTPKLYSRIHRFQKSLLLLGKGGQSLTSIAYECGYFDQSHFIREFSSFTGFTPSALDTANSTAVLASPNK